MAQVRKTKTVLKSERDKLQRFQRFLPTLELKKQQLRMELRRVEAQLREKKEALDKEHDNIAQWQRLFDDERVDFASLAPVPAFEIGTDNIAGVSVPLLKEAKFDRQSVDLYETPAWIDDGLAAAERLMQLEMESRILQETADQLNEELRITSQRVNLFEKVMIPRAKENIRVINIALGDEQTAAVARAKSAKGKLQETESGA